MKVTFRTDSATARADFLGSMVRFTTASGSKARSTVVACGKVSKAINTSGSGIMVSFTGLGYISGSMVTVSKASLKTASNMERGQRDLPMEIAMRASTNSANRTVKVFISGQTEMSIGGTSKLGSETGKAYGRI